MQKFKQFLLIFCLCFLTTANCGKRITPKKIAPNETSWLATYQVFYREEMLVIQAKWQENIPTNFDLANLKIMTTKDGITYQQYKGTKTSKKTHQKSLEILLKPTEKNLFWQLIFINQNKKLATPWRKAIIQATIPKPIIEATVDKAKQEIQLTIYLKNKNDFKVRLYTATQLLPLAEFNNNPIRYSVDSLTKPLWLRYYDKYGNESSAVKISL